MIEWPVFDSQIVTDPVSMERLLGQSGDLSRPQPVEYCVVCGDKASGTKLKFNYFDSVRALCV